jgi:hypothetical protein
MTKAGVLRVANDRSEADDRQGPDQAERARHVVADRLRDHRDQDRQQHECGRKRRRHLGLERVKR